MNILWILFQVQIIRLKCENLKQKKIFPKPSIQEDLKIPTPYPEYNSVYNRSIYSCLVTWHDIWILAREYKTHTIVYKINTETAHFSISMNVLIKSQQKPVPANKIQSEHGDNLLLIIYLEIQMRMKIR